MIKNSDIISGNTRMTLSDVFTKNTTPGQPRKTNPHRYTSQISKSFPLSYTQGGIGKVSYEQPAHKYFNLDFPSTSSALDIEADNTLVEAVRSSKIEFLSEAAEAKETIESIGSVAIRVYKAAAAVRRGRYEVALRHLGVSLRDQRDLFKTPSNFWLAYQFGVSPLVSLVKELNDARIEGFVPQPRRANARKSTVWNTTAYTYSGYFTYKVDIVDSYEVRVGAKFSFGDPSASFANDYGFDNPLTALWQIVPFSFLVDYFLPVGDWLDANFSVVNPTYSDGFKTVVRKRSVTVTCNGTTSNAPVYRDSDGVIRPLYRPSQSVVSTHEYLRYDRVPHFPTFNLVMDRDPFSLNRSLNMLALLFSALR